MTALRFLHTADLHLGKPFGGFAEADRLRVARRGLPERLARIAQAHDAPHILVAGDLFETPNPAAQTWRQAVAQMAEATGIDWWLLPGNHDNLREAAATWDAIAAAGHANIHVLAAPEPVPLSDTAVLLPAPLETRHPSADPTAWMDACRTDPGVLRVGLAHGPVQGFDEGEMPPDIVAPDRDRRARLDYLALGDWHQTLRVSDRVWYAGAPERTDFRHDGRGECLLVEIDAPGATPRVERIETGIFDWRRLTLEFFSGDDPRGRLADTLPAERRRDVLCQVIASGRLPLRGATDLVGAEAELGPDFCHFEVRSTDLRIDVEAADLDAIAPTGALRQAAQALADEAADASLSARDRDVAALALRRLHGYVAGDGA